MSKYPIGLDYIAYSPFRVDDAPPCIVLSVGLQRGQDPFPPDERYEALEAIDTLLAMLGACIIFRGEGEGTYRDGDGAFIVEPSATWVFHLSVHEMFTTEGCGTATVFVALRAAIAAWCNKHGQESVALYEAHPKLLYPL